MPAKTDFKKLLNALSDPELVPLADEAVQHYVSWEQMEEREPLPGLTREETWRLLALVRRFDRITFPIPTLDPLQYWYNITREGEHCLEHIRHHCREDARLHQMLHEREGHRFLVRSQMEESVASCQLDGVIIDEAAMTRMIERDRGPKTSAERLVWNAYEMLSELDALKDEPFSPDLVHRLYERLTRGVALDELERGPRKTNLAGSRNPDGLLDERGVAGRLQMICDYANRETGDPWEPAACCGYMVLSAMAYWHPLPDLNDTVGRHMMRLFAMKNGYPALAYIPTSLMMRQWFDGELKPGLVRFGTYRRRQVIPGEADGTADMLIHLELTTAAIKSLRDYIERKQAEEQELLGVLDSGERLNYRQREVLSRALVHPEAEFRISQHQRSHKVVYQTARTDLLDLTERGFLKMEQRGKAFVFLPAPDLQSRVRRGSLGAA